MLFEIPRNYRFLTKKSDRIRSTYLYIWTNKNNNDNHVNERLCLSTCAHSRWGLALGSKPKTFGGGGPKHSLLDPIFGLEWPLKYFHRCRCWALVYKCFWFKTKPLIHDPEKPSNTHQIFRMVYWIHLKLKSRNKGSIVLGKFRDLANELSLITSHSTV